MLGIFRKSDNTVHDCNAQENHSVVKVLKFSQMRQRCRWRKMWRCRELIKISSHLINSTSGPAALSAIRQHCLGFELLRSERRSGLMHSERTKENEKFDIYFRRNFGYCHVARFRKKWALFVEQVPRTLRELGKSGVATSLFSVPI